MRKRWLVGLVACVMVLAVGCGKDVDTVDGVNKELKATLESALSSLESYDSTYTVSSILEAPDGDTIYIEINCADGNYTEYPVDADGNIGTIENTGEGTPYMLSDWITGNGEMYLVSSDSENNTIFYRLPDKYAEICSSRSVMYVDKMIDRFTSIEYLQDAQADIGNGTETVSLYKCTLPSEYVREILGVGSYSLYDSIRQTHSDNTNVVTLCNYYLKDLDMNLTFSDAYVTLGVVDGMLKYMNLEVGGLGSRLYLTKAVITVPVTVREVPDFSGAPDYVVSMQEYADYIASFGSYEEAIASLNKGHVEENSTIEDKTPEFDTETSSEVEE